MKGFRISEAGRCIRGLTVVGVLALAAGAHAQTAARPSPSAATPTPPLTRLSSPASTPAPASTATNTELPPGTFTGGLKGLSFGLPSGGGTTAGLSYFLSPDTALRLDVGLNLSFAPTFDVGFTLDIGYRVYQPSIGRLRPFLQPTVEFRRGTSSLDLALEGGFGVEYFFTDRISISGATGLAFRITGIGGTGSLGVKIDTGTTGLYVNFYF